MANVDRDEQRRDRRAEAVLAVAEDIVYFGIAALLLAAAGVLLVVAGDEFLHVFDRLGSEPIIEMLDTLLLLFIVVELLSAVRITITKRELVADRSCSWGSSPR